jgi:iron complex outermembrane receptor protein
MNVNLLSCCIVLAAVTQLSFSQEHEEENGKRDSVRYQTDEVVVVGTRSDEKIIDIPYSVFTVDKKELAFGRKISAKDVLADVPGLFLQSRYGNHDLRISLRGFGTRSNSGVRGVRILQEGIPVSEPDGETLTDAIDFTSLGGVEVVKGNLSSLYANAPGGVINFLTDLSFPRSFVGLSSQTGGNGMSQNGFKLGLMNNDNRFFLSYHYLNIDGYRPHSSEFQHLVNATYTATIGEVSKLTMLANYADGLNKLPGSLTRTEFETDPFQAWPVAVSQNFRRHSRKGQVGLKYRTKFGEGNSDEVEVTGYGGLKELEQTDPDFYTFSTRYSLGSLLRYTKRDLVGDDRRNLLTLGMDYAYQSGPITQFDNVSGNTGISVQNEFKEGLSNVGIYILDRIDVVPGRLELLVSGRFDRFAYSRDIRIPYGSTDTSRAFQKFTPRAGLTFKISHVVALYTSYGTSFEYPALAEMGNTQLSSNIKYSINPDLVPQRSKNFELGIKGNHVDLDAPFMPKVFFDVTFFDYIIQDEIVPFIINQKAYFRNAAKTHRLGMEAGIRTHPFEDVEMTVNYSYTRFTYDDYRVKVETPAGPISENFTNNVVPSIPRHIVNFILAHEFEITGELSGLALWDCDYISEMFVDDRNSEKSPAYFYGNFMIGASVSLGSFSAVLYGGMNNTFDKRYSGFININDFAGRFYETGEPRTGYAGVKLRTSL